MDAAHARITRRVVDGVLLLDKPEGLSSHAALQHAKRLYAAQKAGHTGTLDPLASGLLPICFGEATKFAQSLIDARKAYRATLRFGTATSTGDAEGDVVAQSDVVVTREAFERILPRFVGKSTQVPPRYSALKYRGRSHYEYARAGIDVPRAPRPIEIDSIELVAWDFPTATIDVACSKGTYIRTLVEDLAAATASVAYLAALRRIVAGPFTLDRAITFDALTDVSIEARDALLLTIDSPLAEIDRLDVDAVSARALLQGRHGDARSAKQGRYRCFGPDGAFIGVVEVEAGYLRPLRLVRTAHFAL